MMNDMIFPRCSILAVESRSKDSACGYALAPSVFEQKTSYAGAARDLCRMENQFLELGGASIIDHPALIYE